jgi:hypothetical protein
MIVFERECEVRVRREYDSQFNQLREIELSKVRLEEAQNARMLLDSLRKELELDYQRRLASHITREEISSKNAMDRERNMQQTQYEFRQRMQKEVDELRTREASMVKKYELESKGLSLLELRVKEGVTLLESREREIFRREREVDVKVQEYQELARIEARNHLQDELDAVLRERSLVRMERQRVDEDKTSHQIALQEAASYREDLRQGKAAAAAKDEELNGLKASLDGVSKALRDAEVQAEQKVVNERQASKAVVDELAALKEVRDDMIYYMIIMACSN